ncbi:MAG: GNAT family protein [Ferruginibacter sp.]
MTDFSASKDYVLENNAVLLRPLCEDDHEHLVHFSENEPEIWTYSLYAAAGAENLREYIDTALKAREGGTEYPFIVFDKRTQRYAGSTRFYDIQSQHRSLQLGYTWYGKAFQGTKLNKNCKLLLLEFAFEQLNMRRVEFRADNNNERSKAAMKSIGCTAEGVLRNHLLTHTGANRNTIILSILKEEWEGGLKEMLMEKC